MEEIAKAERIIENMGVLELINMKPEDLAGVSLIQNIGVLLVSETLNASLMNIQQRNIGMVITIPETTGKVKVLSGQLTLSGDVFANRSGSPDDILVIAGQAIISNTALEEKAIGYKEVIITGQLLAPKAMESQVVNAVSRLSGQIGYYTSDEPRMFMGEETFSKAFFELIDEKMAMVFIGRFEMDSDVDAATLKQKVSEIILLGELFAPKALIPLIQLLTVVKLGEINVREESEQLREQ
ncbi:hypothetical protein FHS15_001523 [Paenibacillus castaneae]|uniref:hypothetical protein n=1 Tax=Paenibacillus castaneae TaxID=474957 RepID=UPI000C9BDDE7|nr:hypothetical protein [Paenibacillus castaneae]NIK76398.1 hypothetical protein [Paenibacillus castaneae]